MWLVFDGEVTRDKCRTELLLGSHSRQRRGVCGLYVRGSSFHLG